ncbi:hypothetical protein Trydic_g15163 [Trypoxylus dichotomus]
MLNRIKVRGNHILLQNDLIHKSNCDFMKAPIPFNAKQLHAIKLPSPFLTVRPVQKAKWKQTEINRISTRGL